MSTETIPEKELTLKLVIVKTLGFYRFVVANFLFILMFGLAGMIAGITYTWLQDPAYEATVTFTAEEDRNAMSGLQGIAAQFGFNVGETSTIFSGDNLSALIQSRKIITRALLLPVVINNTKTNLLNMYMDIYMNKKDISDTALKNISFPLEQDVSTYSRLQDSVLNSICSSLIKKNVSALKPDKRLDIFAIVCTSKNEVFSVEMTKQLVSVVSSFYIETKTKRSAQTVSILQSKADSIKREYDIALSGRAAISDANLNPAFQSPQVAVQKRQTDITVLSTAYTELIKNLEIAKFNLLQNTPLIQVIDEPETPLKKIKSSRFLTGVIWGILFGFGGIFAAMLRNEIKEIKLKKVSA